jgi:LysM repeat protein
MDRICPLLSLSGDRRTVILGADPAHQCAAERQPLPVDRVTQGRLCLTDAHVRCERYRAHLARYGDPGRGQRALEPGYVSTRLHLVPERSWRALASRTRRTPVVRSVVTFAAAALLVVAGGAVAAGVIGPDVPEPVPPVGSVLSGSAPARPSPSFQFATLAPTPSPTETPVEQTPTPAPTPPATPAPSPTPPVVADTPEPPAAATYVVAPGDSLNSIAVAFGVTPEALAAANGIEDPDVIDVGQVLVIPGS